MARSLEERFSDIYLYNLDMIGEGLPAWVNSARSGHIENFNLVGLPGRGDERYRHTDLRAMMERGREVVFTPVADEKCTADAETIEIVNGFTAPGTGLGRTGEGIVYGSLRAACNDMEQVVARHYNSAADNDDQAVVALNSAFMQDGAFVYVPRGVRTDVPVVVDFRYEPREKGQVVFARALIVCEADSRAQVVIRHAGHGAIVADCVRETVVESGAGVGVSEVFDVADSVSLVAGSYVRQAERSSMDHVGVWLRGGAVRTNVGVELAGAGATHNLYGLCLGSGNERTDLNVSMRHAAPDCNSYQIVKSIVSGAAVSALTDRVYVAPGAQRTVAMQQSRGIQMGDAARIFTEPQLEIYADEVKCSHGATVGQMDDDAIYYMRQRGIGEREARRLQLLGFVNDIVSRCPDPRTREELAAMVGDRLAEL